MLAQQQPQQQVPTGAICTLTLSEPSLLLAPFVCGTHTLRSLWQSWVCVPPCMQSAGVVRWWGRLAIYDPGPLRGVLQPTLLCALHVQPDLPPSLSLSHTHIYILCNLKSTWSLFLFCFRWFQMLLFDNGSIKWLKGNNWQPNQPGWHYTYIRKYRYILLLKLSLKIIYYLHFHWLAVLGVNRIKRYTDHQINWLESRE